MIETARLQLRLPQSEDAEPLMRIHEHPDAIRHVTIMAPPAGLSAAWRNIAVMIGHWHLRGYGHWTVVEKATHEVIGRVGLWFPEGWPGIELGWIIRRDRWNCGFATEAAAASLSWAWSNVDTDHIISVISPENIAAIRVAEKIGERLERRDVIHGVDALVYGARRQSPSPQV